MNPRQFNANWAPQFDIVNHGPRLITSRDAKPTCPRAANTTVDRSHPISLIAFSLIVDDLVFWDGSTQMATLGGGGSQTLFGYSLFAPEDTTTIGLAAGIGARDFPQSARDWLEQNRIDLSGLVLYNDMPTPRAWQILEEDGRRHEIWRTRLPAHVQLEMLLPPLTTLPNTYQTAYAYHLGIHPDHPPLDLLHSIREAGGLLSIETFTTSSSTRPVIKNKDFLQALKLCDVFSPNEEEAISIVYGKNTNSSRESLTQPFIDAGARKIVVRQGPKGASYQERTSSKGRQIAAVPGTRVVDTTGCGNTFCGGVIAGLQAGVSLERAVMWGCAAGSIMAEYRGLPNIPAYKLRNEAQRRVKLQEDS